jgi:hypothetical protein
MNDEIVDDSDDLTEDEYLSDTSPWTPRRVRIPRIFVLGSLGLFLAAVVALGVWGLAQSTWTYGMAAVGRTTTARLSEIEAELRAAGAPQAALQYLSIAARPGVNIGDAIEALVEADKALQPANDNPAIRAAQQNLRAILRDLSNRRYGYSPILTPFMSRIPLPTLDLLR